MKQYNTGMLEQEADPRDDGRGAVHKVRAPPNR